MYRSRPEECSSLSRITTKNGQNRESSYNVFLLVKEILYMSLLVDDIVALIKNLIMCLFAHECFEGVGKQLLITNSKKSYWEFLRDRTPLSNGEEVVILDNGYYLLHDTIQKLHDERSFKLFLLSKELLTIHANSDVSSNVIPIMLKTTGRKAGVIEDRENASKLKIYLKKTHDRVVKDGKFVRVERYDESHRFNEKNIVLNLITQRILFKGAINRGCSSDVKRYLQSVACFPENDITYTTPMCTVYPYPSVLLTCYGAIKTYSIFGKNCKHRTGHLKSCHGCEAFTILRLRTDDIVEHKHFGKICPKSIFNDNTQKDLHLKMISNFDKKILEYDAFVERHTILENLQRDYPFLSFPTTYHNALFYFDGSDYEYHQKCSSTYLRYLLLGIDGFQASEDDIANYVKFNKGV